MHPKCKNQCPYLLGLPISSSLARQGRAEGHEAATSGGFSRARLGCDDCHPCLQEAPELGKRTEQQAEWTAQVHQAVKELPNLFPIAKGP